MPNQSPKSNEGMIVKRDNVSASGLAKEIELLKDLHALAFSQLPGKLGRLL